MIKSHVASRQDVAGSSNGREVSSSVGGGAGVIPATVQIDLFCKKISFRLTSYHAGFSCLFIAAKNKVTSSFT